jgi:hypothetical protein
VLTKRRKEGREEVTLMTGRVALPVLERPRGDLGLSQN